jgi:hypothetical protein
MHDFSPLGDAKLFDGGFSRWVKSRPKTAFREVGAALPAEPPEDAMDDGPWDRVFVGGLKPRGFLDCFKLI